MSRRPASKSRARHQRSNGASNGVTASHSVTADKNHKNHRRLNLFTRCAQAGAHWSGKPVTFLVATLLIVVWAASGPLFGFSDTWQLVVNTTTTIITFLMVFLIQNTQNRDAIALQIKLDELIIAMRGAQNKVAAVEDLSDAELEALHDEYRSRADQTLDSLEERRGEPQPT